MLAPVLALLLASAAPPPDTAYSTPSLVVTAVAEDVYVHTSYLAFGEAVYPCNGLLVVDGGEALIVDSPPGTEAATELLAFVGQALDARVRGVVVNHFHDDCLGGLPAFHRLGIPSYASAETRRLAAADTSVAEPPTTAFGDSLLLRVGARTLLTVSPGPGHTRDNTVSYVTEAGVLFGGCLVKALGGTRGNVADADVEAWPATVRTVAARFPEARVVVPGHGAYGGTELLTYTAELFGGERE